MTPNMTYRTLIWCRMTVENLLRIVWTVFEKIEKSRKTAIFGHFWANFGCFSHPSHTILMPLRTQGPLWV